MLQQTFEIAFEPGLIPMIPLLMDEDPKSNPTKPPKKKTAKKKVAKKAPAKKTPAKKKAPAKKKK